MDERITELLFKDEAFAVIDAAMEVHRSLGWGLLESVYQTALSHELALRNIPFNPQKGIPVKYKDIVAGEYIADFVAYEKIIIEIKTVSNLTSAHQA